MRKKNWKWTEKHAIQGRTTAQWINYEIKSWF